MSRIARWAAMLCVALTAGAAVPAVGAQSTPVGVPSPNKLTSVYPVDWAGQTWLARESGLVRQRPNNNYWLATPDTVFTDSQDRLHMVAREIGGQWFAVGLNSTKSDYGYGTYKFVLDTPMGSLDPQAVIGMFTYNKDVRPSRQESDIELSRWGQAAATARNAQWVVQPWTRPGHLMPFRVPASKPMTYIIDWRPDAVTFSARVGTTGTGRLVNTWTSTKALPGEPTPGTEVHLNLWFRQGQAPYNRQPQEAVFRTFTYTPLAAA